MTQLPFIVYTIFNIVLVTCLIFVARSPRFENRFIAIDVGICALFGGYTVLSTKALSSLLSSLFLGAFGSGIVWLLLFVLVGTSIMQLKYLNRALIRFQSKVSYFGRGAPCGVAKNRKSSPLNLSFSLLLVSPLLLPNYISDEKAPDTSHHRLGSFVSGIPGCAILPLCQFCFWSESSPIARPVAA